jgi:hypothetical protein
MNPNRVENPGWLPIEAFQSSSNCGFHELLSNRLNNNLVAASWQRVDIRKRLQNAWKTDQRHFAPRE